MSTLYRKSLCLVLTLVFFAVQTAWTQQTTPAAPVPPQITAARTVFLSNAGADSFFLNYSDGSNRAYNDLYAAIKQWGKYSIVSSPATANLILKIRSAAPSTDSSDSNGISATLYTPQIRLQLLDPATNTVLWTLTSYIHTGPGRQKTRDKQFDEAAATLFSQLRQLNGETLTPQETKAVQYKPGMSRTGKIVLGVLIAVASIVPIALAIHFAHNHPTLPATAP